MLKTTVIKDKTKVMKVMAIKIWQPGMTQVLDKNRKEGRLRRFRKLIEVGSQYKESNESIGSNGVSFPFSYGQRWTIQVKEVVVKNS